MYMEIEFPTSHFINTNPVISVEVLKLWITADRVEWREKESFNEVEKKGNQQNGGWRKLCFCFVFKLTIFLEHFF